MPRKRSGYGRFCSGYEIVVMPSSYRSSTGSGRRPSTISFVLSKKCFIDTPTPVRTSGM